MKLLIGGAIGLVVGGIAGVFMGAFVVAISVEWGDREPVPYKLEALEQ